MIYKVHLVAFECPTPIREVEVPEPVNEMEGLLEQIFYYGQNDVQTKNNCYSVSMGDVIEINNNEYYLILALGFHKINKNEFEAWKKVDRRDRLFTNDGHDFNKKILPFMVMKELDKRDKSRTYKEYNILGSQVMIPNKPSKR